MTVSDLRALLDMFEESLPVEVVAVTGDWAWSRLEVAWLSHRRAVGIMIDPLVVTAGSGRALLWHLVTGRRPRPPVSAAHDR